MLFYSNNLKNKYPKLCPSANFADMDNYTEENLKSLKYQELFEIVNEDSIKLLLYKIYSAF